MSLKIWPCKPDDYGEVDKENRILSFLLSGLSTVLGHPVAILYEKKDGTIGRADPKNPRQNYRNFCGFFRGNPNKEYCGIPGGEKACQFSDDTLFKKILDENKPDLEIVKMPCSMGVIEVLCPVSVNGARAVFFMGQFRPEKPEDVENIKRAVKELGNNDKTRCVTASESDKRQLLEFIEGLPKLIKEDENTFLDQCRTINKFIEHAIEREKLALHEEISRVLTEKLVEIECPDKDFFEGLKAPLQYLSEQLGCSYAAVFSASSEKDNILRLRSSYGLPQEVIYHPPHFNWNKGSTVFNDGLRDESLIKGKEKEDLCEKAFHQIDLQCKPEFFKGSSCIITSCRKEMPRGIFVFGPFSQERKVDLDINRRFLVGIGYRILIRTSAHDMTQEVQKDATAKRLANRLTIHRIKQIFQSLKSSLDMVSLGVTFEKSRLDMIKVIDSLDEISKRALKSQRFEIDRSNLQLSRVRLGEVLYASIADQEKFAEENGA
ncbi:PocR ligand-binding domain-containing protein, partial [Candidatus Sumerlaeota bacterium]|nr:PocR ligand-binding domain-containing protein [Candidatus Sumerlaeota bacterium]